MKKFAVSVVLALAANGVYAKDLQVIRFGVDPTYAPFESKAPDGKLVGFDIDLGNAICEKLYGSKTPSTASSRRSKPRSSTAFFPR
jgi:histidine transport system substrate-binding protein